uniref:Uncharacterized protein n=1 Tax=Lactuca sativa TaxID=4236 RepID=A0A9R1VJZ4_LACSA|nr:hypothetical protein LSAT_V11C500281040 [Lactuca sativa]
MSHGMINFDYKVRHIMTEDFLQLWKEWESCGTTHMIHKIKQRPKLPTNGCMKELFMILMMSSSLLRTNLSKSHKNYQSRGLLVLKNYESLYSITLQKVSLNSNVVLVIVLDMKE